MLNKNATLTPNSCDFYDLRNFVAKFCCQNLRTFSADLFGLKNWIPQTLSFFGCMDFASGCWVFFRILQPNWSEDLFWGLTGIFPDFLRIFPNFEYFSDFGVFFPIVFFRSFEVYFSKYLKIFPSVQWKRIAKNEVCLEGANNECRNAEMMKMLKMATRSSLCAGSRLLTSDLWRVFKCLIRKGLKKPLWMSYEGRLKSHFTCLVSFFKEGARCACHSLLYF